MKKIFYLLTMLIVFSYACKNPVKSYNEMEERELSKNIRKDDLFLGLQLGMSSSAFFARCKELNGQGIFESGDGGLSVKYEIPKGKMKFDAQVNFYPAFSEDKIYIMPMVFSYKSWAPWSEEMNAIKLIADVKKYAESEYGTGFIPVNDPEKGKFWVKVDGNRRITIKINTESSVKMTIADLTVVKAMEARGKNVAW
ncbi:MAG: hypothetical protein RL757_2145 [Bacteroidota bacterium]|jgi:hypothetical protein